MKKILHILTKPEDSWPQELVGRETGGICAREITVLDLTTAAPDYGRLLDQVMEADTVVVW
jgi:hypothetical protein